MMESTRNKLQRGERILVVDDDPMTRMSIIDVLIDAGLECDDAASGAEALALLEKGVYALMLTDINMPGMDGITLLARAMKQAHQNDRLLGAILITGMSDRETAVRALKMGAHDYIVKPFSVDEVMHAVNSALEKRRLALAEEAYERQLEDTVRDRTKQLTEAIVNLEMAYDATLVALMAALDVRDTDTEGHSQRVANLSVYMGELLGLDENTLTQLRRGALVHDVGKIGIPDAILWKDGRLTPEEMEMMRTHPEKGYRILKDVPFLDEALTVVLHHHEWWDGDGYPHGLKGEQIPLLARIFAVVDSFDAMTNDRPYRQAMPIEAVRDIIRQERGTHLDPQMVDLFLSISIPDLVTFQHAGWR